MVSRVKAGLFALRDSGSFPPRVSIHRVTAEVNRKFLAGILNLNRQIDSLLPERPFIICFIYHSVKSHLMWKNNDYFIWKLILFAMVLIMKNSCLDIDKLF